MNNSEKALLAKIKEWGLSYELRFMNSGYFANIPEIKECWCMNTYHPTTKPKQ